MSISSFGAVVISDPARAKREVETALRKSKGDPVAAARSLGATRRQFDRWLARLGLSGRPVEVRAKMAKKPS